MKTLQIDEKSARVIYNNCAPEFKTLLEDTFGKEYFNQKITDRVKTFDDVLTIAGKTIDDIISDGDTVDEKAYKKAKLIALVYNEGEKLDPKNTNQYKYFPWFKITSGSGSGLSYHDCAYWFSHTSVGVRLCFKSDTLAKDAGEKFPEIYADLLIN